MTKTTKHKNTKTKKPNGGKTAPFWATIFTILSFFILCMLGVWQIQRLDEKKALIAQIEAATAIDPMENRLYASAFINAGKRGEDFISGYVVGRYLHKNEIILGPRTYEGLSGHHIITPAILEDGGTILVNRGWVPEDKAEQENRAASLTPGMTVIAGIARKPEGKGYFTPENRPEKNTWYWPDIEAIAKKHQLINVMPYIFYAQSTPFMTYNFPRPLNTKWMPANNHLGYAIFWFTMAFILLLFYYLRFFSKRRPS